jgi:hypothetical protein
MAEPQRSAGRNAALTIQDRGHAVHRHIDLPREFGGRHPKLPQLFGEVFARVNGCTGHRALLSDNRRFPH